MFFKLNIKNVREAEIHCNNLFLHNIFLILKILITVQQMCVKPRNAMMVLARVFVRLVSFLNASHPQNKSLLFTCIHVHSSYYLSLC